MLCLLPLAALWVLSNGAAERLGALAMPLRPECFQRARFVNLHHAEVCYVPRCLSLRISPARRRTREAKPWFFMSLKLGDVSRNGTGLVAPVAREDDPLPVGRRATVRLRHISVGHRVRLHQLADDLLPVRGDGGNFAFVGRKPIAVFLLREGREDPALITQVSRRHMTGGTWRTEDRDLPIHQSARDDLPALRH